jgi:general secretion pathway protein M
MKTWWQTKTPQEQLAMMIGAAAIALLFLYLLIWRPVAQSLDKQVLQVESQQVTLKWMQDNLDLVKSLGRQQRGKAARSNEALLTLVDRTAKKIQLRQQIKRIKPQGDNAVQLWIEQAPFDTIIKWLGQLTHTHAIGIDSLTIDKQDKPGLVNARLVLQREGRS